MQKMPTLPILDLNHPKIRINPTLPANGFVHIPVRPFGQDPPSRSPGQKVKRPLKRPRLPIERIQFGQNRPAGVIPSPWGVTKAGISASRNRAR